MTISNIGGWIGKSSPVVYVITMLMLSGCSTVSGPAQSAFMPLGEAAAPPIGYLKFCTQRPDDCRSAPTAVAAVRPPMMTAGLAANAAPPLRQAQNSSLLVRDTGWSAPAGRNGGLKSQPGFSLVSLETSMPSGGLGDGARWWRQPADDDAGVVASLATEAAVPSAPVNPLSISPLRGSAASAAASPAPLVLDGALLAKLNITNRRINYAFLAKPDVETFGDSDYWHLPLLDGTGVGDCKDFVLEKRRALVAAGVPADALSIAIVRTRRGEGHAVLLVATDRGEYVLDNLTPWVMPWRAVDYQWQKRQVPGQPLNWVSIDGSS